MGFLSALLERWRVWRPFSPDTIAVDTAYGSPSQPSPAAEPVVDTSGLPRFRASAMDRPMRGGGGDLVKTRLKLREVFTPAQPVTERRLFAGRLRVLATLIEIIEERMAHVVVFGERGIGKTSLLHVFAGIAQESRYIVVRATCGATSSFDDVFRTMLSEIPIYYLSSVSPTDPEAEKGASLADRLPEGAFDARELSNLLVQVTGTRILVMLDEYDRAESAEFRQSIAELIKNLSDRAARVQLVLAGVASNLQDLIGHIPSIRRNIIGLPMPRLTLEEVQALMRIGEERGGVRFTDDVADIVYAVSNGSPYLTRLICHHAGTVALDDGRVEIGREDIDAALDRMIDEAEGRLMQITAQRAKRLRIDDRHDLLGAISRAAATPDGWFAASDLLAQLGNEPDCEGAIGIIGNEFISAGLIEDEQSGGQTRYRFADEGLANYLWVMVARDRFSRKGAAVEAEPPRDVKAAG